VVPLDRIILETDAPYMAPVPHRGQRNEPAFVREVLLKLAEAYQLSTEETDRITTQNTLRIFKRQSNK
jgi:TatD DNase family protein